MALPCGRATTLKYNDMPLKQFKGYYVDYRLRQFRSAVPFPEVIEFLDFDSDKGRKLLLEMIRNQTRDV